MAKLKAVNHPWVQAAAFCDQVLEDSSGSLSIIRIVDRFTVPKPPDWDGKTHLPLPLTAVLAFKAGDVKGKWTLTLYHYSPKGKKKRLFQKQVEFFGGEVGTNIRLRMNFGFKSEGTHWIEVYVGDWLATRMPLVIALQPAESQQEKPTANQNRPRKKS